MSKHPTPRGESDGPGCPVFAMRPAERPTPITDAYIGDSNDDDMTEGEIAMCEFARNLERQLAEARDEINEWKTLQGWGGTPEIINAFIKGQQSRIHAAQDIERQLADALAHLRIADEQLTLERGALAAALRERDEARRERDNALSDWRQADSDTVRALHERNEAREQRNALEGAIKRGIYEFDRIDAATPWSESEPKWWIAWSEWAQEARSNLAALNDTTPEQS